MPILSGFGLASTAPADLVNRQADVEWLRSRLASVLQSPDDSQGRAMALIGDRGVGKSIVMRKVIEDLRELHQATTLFAIVNCETVRDQRGVYRIIAHQILQQLGRRGDIDSATLAAAALLEEIAKFHDVEQRTLAEHAVSYAGALKFVGTKLLRMLGIAFGINLAQSKQARDSLEGSKRIDGLSLRESLIALFEDLRSVHKLDIVIVLDNLDELDHQAITSEDERRQLLSEIDGMLGLALAPIGLVVTVRTYFGGALNRRITNNRRLGRLAADDHQQIMSRRLARQSERVQSELSDPASLACMRQLSELAPTPLALLSWFSYLCENDMHRSDDVKQALRGILIDKFSYVDPALIERVARLFADKPIVLPLDYWHPHEFTLMPDLHFLV